MSQRIAGVLLALLGAGVIGFWVVATAGGQFADGLATVAGENYLAFHVAAELLMGALALAAGLTLWLRWRGARSLALLSAGALIYSTINSMGYSFRTDPSLTPVFAISLALTLAALGLVLRSSQPSR